MTECSRSDKLDLEICACFSVYNNKQHQYNHSRQKSMLHSHWITLISQSEPYNCVFLHLEHRSDEYSEGFTINYSIRYNYNLININTFIMFDVMALIE